MPSNQRVDSSIADKPNMSEKLIKVTPLESKNYLGIDAVEYLQGVVDLHVDDECEELGQEPEEGNMEYKLKLVNPSIERLEHLTTQMNWRLKEGRGEAIYRVGVTDQGHPQGISDAELRATIKTIQTIADRLNSSVLIVRVAKGPKGKMAELVIRKSVADFVNIRLCIVGSVDSGKSTLVGVLTTGKLDDGKGVARTGVLRHRHEIQSGRSSSISQQILGFDSKGDVTNYTLFENSSVEDILEDSSKVLTLIDLAGHERYLKTTVLGLTGHLPDYSLVAIAADAQVPEITKQHIGVCAALSIPLFIVLTKIDKALPERLQQTCQELSTFFAQHHPQISVRFIESMEDVTTCSRTIANRMTCPIFRCSSVTGAGLDNLKTFLHLLPKHQDWKRRSTSPSVFCIDEIFYPSGVGVAVSGFVLRGVIKCGEMLLLGPTEQGKFVRVVVTGLHMQRRSVPSVAAGQAATVAFKKLKGLEIRKGMALIHSSRHPRAVIGFDASVLILHEDNGIRLKSEPVIHIGTVRQVARICSIAPITNPQAEHGATPSSSPRTPIQGDAFSKSAPAQGGFVSLTLHPADRPLSTTSEHRDMQASVDDSAQASSAVSRVPVPSSPNMSLATDLSDFSDDALTEDDDDAYANRHVISLSTDDSESSDSDNDDDLSEGGGLFGQLDDREKQREPIDEYGAGGTALGLELSDTIPRGVVTAAGVIFPDKPEKMNAGWASPIADVVSGSADTVPMETTLLQRVQLSPAPIFTSREDPLPLELNEPPSSSKAPAVKKERSRSKPPRIRSKLPNESSDDSVVVSRLVTGDRALVHFEFRLHPEFVLRGSRIIFREGSAKGIGRIVKLYYCE